MTLYTAENFLGKKNMGNIELLKIKLTQNRMINKISVSTIKKE